MNKWDRKHNSSLLVMIILERLASEPENNINIFSISPWTPGPSGPNVIDTEFVVTDLSSKKIMPNLNGGRNSGCLVSLKSIRLQCFCQKFY